MVCLAKYFYCDYEFKIYKNCLDLDFLTKFQSNVYRNLSKLLTPDNHFVCQIVNNEYYDWFNGFYQKYSLSYCVDFYEQRRIDLIKKNECKILIEPIDLKKIFTKMIFFSKKKRKMTKS